MAYPFPAWVHGLFVVLGTAAAMTLALVEGRRRGRLDDRLVTLVLGGLVSGALGAKLATLWPYLQKAAHPTLWGVVVEGGKSILGGLAGAYLGVLLTKRLLGLRQQTGDIFAPAVALGIGIGRFGCLLTEPPGTPTGFSWGWRLSREQMARLPGFHPEWTGRPLHPSFAYEIAFHIAMLAVLLRLRARPEWRERLFRLYLLAYALFRFAVEWVRGNEVVWAGLTRSQLFLIPSALLLAASLAFGRRGGSMEAPPLRPRHV
jgi:phosphatidylglycerol:prolipoprotein diacylglycerol transferase